MDIKGTYRGGYGTNKQTVRRYDHQPPTAADIREVIGSHLAKMRVCTWVKDQRELVHIYQHNDLTRLIAWIKSSCDLAGGR